jgi:hypothetical protein
MEEEKKISNNIPVLLGERNERGEYTWIAEKEVMSKEMAEKSILFNTEMVRAILNGRKTVTRRKINSDIISYCDIDTDGTLLDYENKDGDFINPVKLCKYQSGDILYVRETVWQKTCNYLDVDGETKTVFSNEFRYPATDIKPEVGNTYSWVKRPSIHMPKEAARIWLRVTDVRVERLREMKDEDFEKEGIENYCKKCKALFFDCDACLNDGAFKEDFIKIWDATIKKSDLEQYGWKANPWVWVIEFERCDKTEGE